MMLLICGASSTSTAVMATARTANMTMAVPTVRPPFLRSPQPICWPSKIVVPMAKLLTRLVSVIMICEPVDTADTSAGEANLPTMSSSTAPYIACKNRANSTGSAKNDQRLQNFTLDKSILLLFLYIAPRLCCATTKSRIRNRYFNPPSYPAIVSYEQIVLR